MKLIYAFIATLLVNILPTGLCAQGVDTATFNYDSLAAKITANQTGFKTLAVHAKLIWDDGSTEQPVQANIRMLKDSIVWMSLTGAVGIEGGRVLINPDSFRLISKLTQEYSLHGFSYVNNWLMFPVSFKMLQQIIAGEKLDIGAKATMATYQDSAFMIYAESDNMLEKIWVNTGNYTISKILLKDKLLKQSMVVTFDAYGNLNGKPFSYKRLLEVNRDGVLMKLSMEVSKVRVNEELSYPFEINEKYKRVDEH